MRETWEEVRSALRRRMRMFSPLGNAARRREEQRRQEDAERKAIVSVEGRDLSSEDEIADAPPAPAKDAA